MNEIQAQDFTKIRKLCNHEAGHYVIGKNLNFITRGIKLLYNTSSDYKGSAVIQVWTRNIHTIEEIKNYLKRRIKVLYAGVIAEATDENKSYNSSYADIELETGGSKYDNYKIIELKQVLRNIQFPSTTNEDEVEKELATIEDELKKQTIDLVQNEFENIYAIGDLLFQKVKNYSESYQLSEEEINKVFK